MRAGMMAGLILSVLVGFVGAASAEDSQVSELKERVATLEKRVSTLETRLNDAAMVLAGKQREAEAKPLEQAPEFLAAKAECDKMGLDALRDWLRELYKKQQSEMAKRQAAVAAVSEEYRKVHDEAAADGSPEAKAEAEVRRVEMEAVRTAVEAELREDFRRLEVQLRAARAVYLAKYSQAKAKPAKP